VLSPWPAVREEALARYVGTLLGRISLYHNRRLYRSLQGTTDQERLRELVERLPGAILQAFKEGYGGDGPQAVLRRATRQLEGDQRSRRRYRPRTRGYGSDGYDPAKQPWPIPPHMFDPSQIVVDALRLGMAPDDIDQVLRSENLGTYEETAARIAFWMPERHREFEDLVRQQRTDRLPWIEEFANREQAAAALVEPEIDEAMVLAVAEFVGTAKLTPREAGVAALLAMGLCPIDVAKRLGIAHSTVRVHRRNATEKLKRVQSKH
jgi:DNA-binding NarL/FixJ family response regulator